MVDGELQARIVRLDQVGRHLRAGDMVREVAAIRNSAEAYGLLPVVAVARALESALAHGEGRLVVAGWLGVLRDAGQCERRDADAARIYCAAGAVRLTG
ncbi:hypothetical protein [uncultured Sphingomonas sp.]|uniref:hypothetical protein n=1 Tax=uncultured Sphingomonas sp. TaxID=158754 RepID=UPI0035CBE2C4